MSSVTINTELRTRYNSWANKPTTEFPNEDFTPPNPPAFWARFTIIGGEEQRMEIGSQTPNRFYRKPGVLIVQLFYPLAKGNNAILTKADELAALFRNWCGNTVACGASSINEIGNDGNGYYQCNVSVPFHQDSLL